MLLLDVLIRLYLQVDRSRSTRRRPPQGRGAVASAPVGIPSAPAPTRSTSFSRRTNAFGGRNCSAEGTSGRGRDRRISGARGGRIGVTGALGAFLYACQAILMGVHESERDFFKGERNFNENLFRSYLALCLLLFHAFFRPFVPRGVSIRNVLSVARFVPNLFHIVLRLFLTHLLVPNGSFSSLFFSCTDFLFPPLYFPFLF